MLCPAVSASARFKDELLPHLENKKVEVYWADHRLAALWANSDAAKAEFPDYSYLVGRVGHTTLCLEFSIFLETLLQKPFQNPVNRLCV